jgi:hypothetical protein
MPRTLIMTVVLLWVAGAATAGIIDPCGSTATFNGPAPACYFACPAGDTESFAQAGFSFSFRIVDRLGQPIPNIPRMDFWLIDCDPTRNLVLCAGSASSNADSSTNYDGRTTMSSTRLAVGGCANGVSAVCQGYVFGPGTPSPCQPPCFDIRVRSTDLDGNLRVELTDFSAFASRYPPHAYDECSDFNGDGRVSLADVARLAAHYGHVCV